ncbi:WYL domain-containing protein [Paenibacillus sp. FSL M8-0228]|uniref:helix-turn-helix transcriptional regulator n=1 Tax=Paenibacillus TaxID=44249 RepID=UPI0009C01CC6|nr:WYL domain-containing protein [Paenibacillus polymyxa]MBO3287562.1 WYL domain-containing protein [Paenibacillus polymyxa]
MKINQFKGDLKAKRILIMYERLVRGKGINKQIIAEEFKVSEKTIQRDLEDLRSYLAECFPGQEVTIQYIKGKGHLLNCPKGAGLTGEEAVLLTKILLESRAFPKDEMEKLLDKVIGQCEEEERKKVYKAIRNESFLYKPVGHNKPLGRIIGDLSHAISEQRLVTLCYLRPVLVEPFYRRIEPLGILFSEYYFYLIANISGSDKEFPAIYRLDRIIEYTVEKERFHRSEQSRFQEGEFRKQIQFMQMGKLMHVKFKFWGTPVEAVTDRLPNSIVTEEVDGSYLVEAKVFGKGVKMWLLSQAEFVEVLAPQELREDIAASIKKMDRNYS